MDSSLIWIPLYTIIPLPELKTKLDSSQIYMAHFVQFGFLFGSLIGTVNGFKQRELSWMAENIHRLPKTKVGWYFFSRQKQKDVMNFALKRGLRVGFRIGSIFSLFAIGDYCMECITGDQYWYNPMGGGLLSATAFSTFYKLPISSVKKAFLFSIGASLSIGVLHDVYSYFNDNMSIKDRRRKRDPDSLLFGSK